MDSPTEPERKDSRLYLIICAAAVVLASALLIVPTSLPLHHCDVTELAHEFASAAVALFVITGLLSVLGATGAGGLRGWFEHDQLGGRGRMRLLGVHHIRHGPGLSRAVLLTSRRRRDR